MPKLAESKCEACRLGAEPVTATEERELLEAIPNWSVIQDGSPSRLQRAFRFTNFLKALEFSCRVGEIAEAEDHHPSLLTEWGRVTVTWWTHKIKGLHKNDFIMAAKTDQLYERFVDDH
jgi:4a-hydroxytetrahydrobiopterin dehydratase